MRSSWILLTTVLLGAAVIDARYQSSDEQAVRRTVQFYLDGLKANDIPTTQKAFHPGARLYWVQHDTLASYNQTEWFRAARRACAYRDRRTPALSGHRACRPRAVRARRHSARAHRPRAG